MKFRRELFWDINEKDIERTLKESDDWVIVRVFEYGSLEEISRLIQLYGESKIKAVLAQSQLRPMARAMAFLFLDIQTPNYEERPLFYK
jgi:hypothetical protein